MAKSDLTPTGVKDNSRKKGVLTQEATRRREEAQIRQSEYNKLTPEQKLAKLDAGGFRAERQRAKLTQQIEAAKQPLQGAQK